MAGSSRRCGGFLFTFAILLGWTTMSPVAARGAFATGVVNYTPGSLVSPSLNNPGSALGIPTSDTGFGVLTPFNPAFAASDIVEIGPGGSLVLQLGAPAPTGAGRTLGVHAAVGLVDTDFPNGNPGPTATLFTQPRSATVLVSDDNVRWHSLGAITFDLPTNFYSEGVTTPGFQDAPGTLVADFTKPFAHTLADFNGRNWSQILTLLDGSAGGTWLDLTGVPYPAVNYLRFDVTTGQRMILDAVAVVPEPVGAAVVVGSIVPLLRRRA
jgi:hypothetical protein